VPQLASAQGQQFGLFLQRQLQAGEMAQVGGRVVDVSGPLAEAVVQLLLGTPGHLQLGEALQHEPSVCDGLKTASAALRLRPCGLLPLLMLCMAHICSSSHVKHGARLQL
jgi:hypothetical protein